MDQKSRAILLLGSNLEPRLSFLRNAESMMEQMAGRIIGTSSVYETESWGFYAGDPFLNRVIIVETSLSPLAMLRVIHHIEDTLGRKRNIQGYESRTIDIDILFFDNLHVVNNQLIIPHPKIPVRKFVLVPLCEILPDMLHPVLNIKISELELSCPDTAAVEIFKSANTPV
ncbi:MAG: 2-amino-4-hydroxy-6-hydroxymethyldihydropteridine diphosphokinase [Bacteroidales bacterium]|nr:2-amino-4-hydroxy-6-hydroxymethyldihydropteridine diphosphokinase [Bacteroidales bacterium]